MDRTLELELTAQALQYVDNRLGDYADDVYETSVDVYTSTDRAAEEMDRIFHSAPIVAGLSCELPEANDHKTIDIAGVPVIVRRDDAGVVHAFLNVCRHRGAAVVEETTGNSRRMTCPYHGWAYEFDGTLCGVGGANSAFESMEREDRSLVPLPVAERNGVIWVIANVDAGLVSLSDQLGEIDDDLGQWDFGSCVVVDRRIHQVEANWKLTVESFLENYHLKALHKDTLAPIMTSHGTCHRPFGDSQRMVYPGHSLESLKGTEPEDWQAFAEWGISVVYNVFPNSIIVLLGEHYQLFQIFPGDTPSTSTVVQTVLAQNAEQAVDNAEALLAQAELLSHVLVTEDFRVVKAIGNGLASGANKTLVFGRNEIPIHHFHQQIDARL